MYRHVKSKRERKNERKNGSSTKILRSVRWAVGGSVRRFEICFSKNGKARWKSWPSFYGARLDSICERKYSVARATTRLSGKQLANSRRRVYHYIGIRVSHIKYVA